MKIEILITDPGHPINIHLYKLQKRLAPFHTVSIHRTVTQITTGDILFLVSANEIVNRSILKGFKHAMVLHASDLPKGRGWSPHIWEIVNGAEQVTVSLLDAADKVDCGDIYRKVVVDIPKTALWYEINELVFNEEINLIEYAIENLDNLSKTPQSLNIAPTYFPKRHPKDSEINPNKTISEQFDLIRVCDPNRYPAIFYYGGEAYKLKLEKL